MKRRLPTKAMGQRENSVDEHIRFNIINAVSGTTELDTTAKA
jgi:hypothetical protein